MPLEAVGRHPRKRMLTARGTVLTEQDAEGTMAEGTP